MTGKPGRSGGKGIGSGKARLCDEKEFALNSPMQRCRARRRCNIWCATSTTPVFPEKRRDELAIAALPYCSPRLAAVVMQHSNVEPIREVVWRVLPAQPASLIEHEAGEAEEG